jgi:tetratricopeptide (TPR) repeat protein
MEQNLKIGEELNYKKGVAKSLNTLGDIYFYKNDYTSSLQYYDRSIEVTRGIGNKLVLGLSLVEKGNVLLALGQLDGAQDNLDEALQLAKELNQPDLLFEANLLSAKLAAAKKANEDALHILEGLLSTQPGKKEEATIYFEMGKLKPESSFSKRALDLFEELYEAAPVFVYQQRIEELKNRGES